MSDFIFSEDGKDSLGLFFLGTGAGSVITEIEAKDRQLTFSNKEKDLLKRHYKAFPRGSLKAARTKGQATDFRFRLWPSGQEIELRINHPKSTGNELRLYFQSGRFSPEAGDFWSIFERSGELWLAALSEREFNAASLGSVLFDVQDGLDAENEVGYQSMANLPPDKVPTVTWGYRRNPRIASDALSAANFCCEMLPSHPTFTSATTSKPYMEAHHFFPLSEQKRFHGHSLDVSENICVLNPYAHKMVHHATYSEIEKHLKKLAEPREEFLKTLNIGVDEVLRCYGAP